MASQLRQPWKNATPATTPTAHNETWMEAYESNNNLCSEASNGIQAEIKMNKVVTAKAGETWLEAYESDKNLMSEASNGIQAEIKMNKIITK